MSVLPGGITSEVYPWQTVGCGPSCCFIEGSGWNWEWEWVVGYCRRAFVSQFPYGDSDFRLIVTHSVAA